MNPQVANARAAPNMPAEKTPRILSSECLDEMRWRLALDVPWTLRWFDGHFPGHAVLPGVAQIDWAIRLAHGAFELPLEPPRIERVKFQRIVEPGDRLSLDLCRAQVPSGPRIEWIFRRAEEIVSRGRLEFDA
jgi:hypothetical protein